MYSLDIWTDCSFFVPCWMENIVCDLCFHSSGTTIQAVRYMPIPSTPFSKIRYFQNKLMFLKFNGSSVTSKIHQILQYLTDRTFLAKCPCS